MSIPSSSITLYKSLQAQSKPYHQVEGVRWRRDWRDVPALSLASLILLAWIIAAAYVAGQRTTLPLTYWHTRYHGVLDNGNYNTLIAVAGGLAGALVCFGLAQAVKDVLRKEALSENGISLSKYSTLTKLANQGIEIRWHVSALLPLALFVLINLFGAATQAAFGASIAKYNITVPFPLMRLSSNAAAMTQTLSFRDGSNPVLYTGAAFRQKADLVGIGRLLGSALTCFALDSAQLSSTTQYNWATLRGSQETMALVQSTSRKSTKP